MGTIAEIYIDARYADGTRVGKKITPDAEVFFRVKGLHTTYGSPRPVARTQAELRELSRRPDAGTIYEPVESK